MFGCDDCLSRRNFLSKGAQTLTTLAVAVPLASLLSSCGTEAQVQPTGNLSGELKPDGAKPPEKPSSNMFTFDANPTLQTVGGTMLATIQTPGGAKEVYLTRASLTEAIAVATLCTHRGVKLDAYDPAKQNYRCSAHGSEFGVSGAVNRGPAKLALEKFACKLSDTGIEVLVA